MSFVAAVQLITDSKEIGSPILGAAMLVFNGKEEHHYSWIVQGWESWDSKDVLAQFKKENLLALSHTAEVITPDMFASRIAGRQAFHNTAATIWQNDIESHVTHRAYLYAVTADKKKMYEKGFNFDGESLSAASRYAGDVKRWTPSCTDNPVKGPEFLMEAFFLAREYLGHDMESQSTRTLRKGGVGKEAIAQAAPKLAAAVAAPKLPPALPPKLPPMPGAPKLPPLPGK